ncbi:hypothetical protein LZC95_15100 [Pendulispora brunnea]|uniref:A-factor biosynthesis hotdog domain-containing protein n=1 Tax=Pendulispora brunnea TaxID=2905690 RepID=A0ABZ2KHK1_9BACT
MKSTLLVVGDRFVAPRMPENVIGFSAFVANLREDRSNEIVGERHIYIGQGINPAEERALRSEVLNSAFSQQIVLHDGDSEKVARSQVHKHQEENILIAGLEPIGEHEFSAKLKVDGDNELVLDHTSGWHISGMVILEAMRQMAMAVTERYYADYANEGGGRGFAIQSWDTKFESFLFPLDSTLTCKTEVTGTYGKRVSFRAELSVLQCGRVSARAAIEYTVMDGEVMSSIEARRAREVVRQLAKGSSLVETEQLATAV